MLDAGQEALNLYFMGFCFMAFQFCGQCAFVALGRSKQAVFFSLLRKAVIVAPLTILLPGLLPAGAWSARSISCRARLQCDRRELLFHSDVSASIPEVKGLKFIFRLGIVFTDSYIV